MFNHLPGFVVNLRVISCTRRRPFALRAKSTSQPEQRYPTKNAGLLGEAGAEEFGIILGYVATSGSTVEGQKFQ
jgi:hypothetical protein